MKKKSELILQVSESIVFAKDYCETSGFDLLWNELQSAHKWIAGVGDELSPQDFDKISNIVTMLHNIAEIAEDRELNFLAANFERLAANITRCLESEPEQLEGKTDVSL